jgi:sulfate adenylyltransferase
MSIVLDKRQLCDLELILNGGFYPLKGFMSEKDFNNVLENMRLSTGELWPMPIVLKINKEKMKELKNLKEINLLDSTNLPLAKLFVDDIYKPDLIKECKSVFGTDDDNHPYIKKILQDKNNTYYIGGKLEKINLPLHFDFTNIRMTPEQTKKYFKDNCWDIVLGFQTRNPMHRSHMELTKYALKCIGVENAKLFLNPVVGATQECDVDYYTRVKCYKILMKYYPENTAILNLLPLSMRMAGPREALWHALIRQNYGCTHFVVGRDHAGPSYKKKDGSSFFGPYDAHELLERYEDELDIKVIKSQWIVYVEDTKSYMRIDQVPEGMKVLNISGTEQRRMLRDGEDIPEWFSFPDVVSELRKKFKPKHKQGLCLYFVGLSGSGKSTIANSLKSKIMELDNREISILDGDVIRQNLSKGLTFSREDRSTNVRRIGYVASEIVKHEGIVFCANIAPYESDRLYNKELISKHGNYIEIYVKTDLDVCEKRDVKGLYKLARHGILKFFTGISDPFEEPKNPDLIINGAGELNIKKINYIIDYLCDINLIKKK